MAVPLPTMPPEIVVTGAGLPAALGDEAYDVAIITRERLTGAASGRLEDVLRDVAGFAQFRRSDARSAHPTSQGATLRGLGGNASSRALLLLDGVPQSDPFGGYVSFAAFDPERLGTVRVTRGGGSGVFGPGALAGTIELTSAGAADLARLSAGVAHGSRDSREADLGLSGRLGGGVAFIALSHAAGDGFTPVIARQRGPADRPAAYAQTSVATRAVLPLAPEAELQAAALLFRDSRERGIAFTGNRQQGADASLRLIGRGRWGLEALAYVQLRDLRSGFASIDPARTAAAATLDQYAVPATGVGGRIELRPPLGDGAELRLGADFRTTSGRTQEFFQFVGGTATRQRIAGGETRTVGAFGEASLALGRALTLTGGARIDRWRIGDGWLRERQIGSGSTLAAIDYTDRAGWRPTARAGLAYHPGRAVTLRTAAYLGWRLPTLNELYRPFRVGADATAADATLRPERSRGADVGIDYQPLPGWRASATLFATRLDDAIANISLGRGPGQFPQVGFVSAAGIFRRRGNLDAIDSRGVELDGRARWDAWSLAASYAYTDARVHAAGLSAALDGLRPAQTAPHQGSATLAWAAPFGPALSASLRYVAAQFEDDQNSLRLADAVSVDLTARLPLGRALSIEARAENVADRRVAAGITGGGVIERAAPRTLWLGLRLGL